VTGLRRVWPRLFCRVALRVAGAPSELPFRLGPPRPSRSVLFSPSPRLLFGPAAPSARPPGGLLFLRGSPALFLSPIFPFAPPPCRLRASAGPLPPWPRRSSFPGARLARYCSLLAPLAPPLFALSPPPAAAAPRALAASGPLFIAVRLPRPPLPPAPSGGGGPPRVSRRTGLRTRLSRSRPLRRLAVRTRAPAPPCPLRPPPRVLRAAAHASGTPTPSWCTALRTAARAFPRLPLRRLPAFRPSPRSWPPQPHWSGPHPAFRSCPCLRLLGSLLLAERPPLGRWPLDGPSPASCSWRRPGPLRPRPWGAWRPPALLVGLCRGAVSFRRAPLSPLSCSGRRAGPLAAFRGLRLPSSVQSGLPVLLADGFAAFGPCAVCRRSQPLTTHRPSLLLRSLASVCLCLLLRLALAPARPVPLLLRRLPSAPSRGCRCLRLRRLRPSPSRAASLCRRSGRVAPWRRSPALLRPRPGRARCVHVPLGLVFCPRLAGPPASPRLSLMRCRAPRCRFRLVLHFARRVARSGPRAAASCLFFPCAAGQAGPPFRVVRASAAAAVGAWVLALGPPLGFFGPVPAGCLFGAVPALLSARPSAAFPSACCRPPPPALRDPFPLDRRTCSACLRASLPPPRSLTLGLRFFLYPRCSGGSRVSRPSPPLAPRRRGISVCRTATPVPVCGLSRGFTVCGRLRARSLRPVRRCSPCGPTVRSAQPGALLFVLGARALAAPVWTVPRRWAAPRSLALSAVHLHPCRAPVGPPRSGRAVGRAPLLRRHPPPRRLPPDCARPSWRSVRVPRWSAMSAARTALGLLARCRVVPVRAPIPRVWSPSHRRPPRPVAFAAVRPGCLCRALPDRRSAAT